MQVRTHNIFCARRIHTICSNKFWTKIVKSCAFSGGISSFSDMVAKEKNFLSFRASNFDCTHLGKVALLGNGAVVVAASDRHAFNAIERQQLEDIHAFVKSTVQHSSDAIASNEPAANEDEEENAHVNIRGPVPESLCKWASCLAVINPSTGQKHILELEKNEAAFSVCVCSKALEHAAAERFVVVGTAVGLQIHSRTAEKYFLLTYQFVPTTSELILVHRTSVENLPMCLMEFGNGRVLAGVGKTIRLYEIGLKQMLRKSESKEFPSAVVRLDVHGSRIFVGDMSESVFLVKFKRTENAFIIFAEDVIPRWTSAICSLDHHTICGTDKFGNMFVMRAPENADEDVDGSTGARILWDAGGRIQLSQECQYYQGEMMTSIHKMQFIAGGKDILVAATLGGELQAFIPLTSKGDLNFYTALETFLRTEMSFLCGRIHQSYRSYYQPVRHVLDGDLCALYATLPFSKQLAFAEEQGRTVPEVLKKLEEIRDIMA